MRFEAFTAIECREVVSGDQLCKSGRFAVIAASHITLPAHTSHYSATCIISNGILETKGAGLPFMTPSM
jgi:hypothetical protein